MKTMILAVLLIGLCGCAPVGHLTGTYDPTSGDITAGVDIEIKNVEVEVSPGHFQKRTIRIPKSTTVKTVVP